MAKKKGDYQPTKYDWISLEAEFMVGDEANVAKFFKHRGIPMKTYQMAAKGWGEKWKAVREKGLKTFQNRLSREIAEQAETELVISKGLIRVGADALFPENKDVKGLRPTTAREAAQIIHLGNTIRKNVVGSMQEAVRVEVSTTQAPAAKGEGQAPNESPVVTVKIMGPSNGRDQASG